MNVEENYTESETIIKAKKDLKKLNTVKNQRFYSPTTLHFDNYYIIDPVSMRHDCFLCIASASGNSQ